MAKLGKRNAPQANLVKKMMADTDGEIPAFKLGGMWRFRRSEFDTWITKSIRQKTDEAK